MKRALWAVLVLVLSPAPAPAETWEIRRGPSEVGFSVEHAVFFQVRGEFRKFAGTVVCPAGDLSKARIDVMVDVGSVSTGHRDRDRHLRGEEFFFEKRFPQMRYVSRAVEHVGGDRYEITGDLTIRGVTKEVKLDAELTGRRWTARGERMDFVATGMLNRYDFGLRWNDLLETGALMVAEEVRLRLDVALRRVG